MPANSQNQPQAPLSEKNPNRLNILLNSFCNDPNDLQALYDNQQLIPQLKDLIAALENSKKLNKDRISKIFTICENLGNFLFQAREHDGFNPYQLETQNKTVELINAIPLATADELSRARNAFLKAFNSPGDIAKECYRLFDTTDCDGLGVSQEFNLIAEGKNSLVKNMTQAGNILKKLRFTLQIPTEFDKYIKDTNNLDNLLNYLKEEIKIVNQQGGKLEIQFINDLCGFIHDLTAAFARTNPQSKFYRSSFSLLLSLLKNPSLEEDIYYIPEAIIACADQMKILLTDGLHYSSKNPVYRILSTMNILADIFHQANDLAILPAYEKLRIASKIEELSLICLKLDNCTTTIGQFVKTLGAMNRNLFKQNNNATEVPKIQAIAQRIVANAQRDVPEAEFKGLAWNYLKGRHDNNVNAIRKNCKEIFNLTDCREFISINETADQDIDMTTIIPEITTTTEIIPRVIPLHLNETTIPVNTTTETSITTTALPLNVTNNPSFNQTAADTVNEKNTAVSLSNPGLTLGAAAAHGVGSGMLNGIIQHFATRASRQGEPSSKAKAIALYTSLFAHAAFAATFPLMLFKIQEHLNQGNEDEAQQLWDNLLYQALPTFISSASLSLGLHALISCTHLLTKRFGIQVIAKNTIPVLGTAYNAVANPRETAVHLGTSIATSSLTYGLLNRFFPAKNQQSLDIESVKYDVQKNEVEMNPLIGKKIETINEVAKKKYNFINQNTLDKIRTDLIEPIIALAHLCTVYRARIDTMETITENMQKIDPNKSIDFKKVISKDSEDFTTLRKNLISLDKYRILLGTLDIMNFHPDSYLNKIKSMLIDYMHRINIDEGTIQKEIKDYLSYDKNDVILEDIGYSPERLKEISESVKIPGKPDILPSLDSLMEFAKEGYSKHNEACGFFENKKDFIINADSLCALLRNLNCLITTTLDDLKAIGGLETSSNIEKKDLSANANKPYLRNKEMKYIIQILHPLSLNLATIIKKHEGLVHGDDADKLISQANGHLRSQSISVKDNRRNTVHFYSNSSGSDGEARFSVASSSDESAKSDGYGNSALNNIEEQQLESLMNTRLRYS